MSSSGTHERRRWCWLDCHFFDNWRSNYSSRPLCGYMRASLVKIELIHEIINDRRSCDVASEVLKPWRSTERRGRIGHNNIGWLAGSGLPKKCWLDLIRIYGLRN